MKTLQLLAAGSLLALILLSIAWELWLAPLHPHGSWLVLKALPLMAAVPGVLTRRRYTFQWSSMLILLYFIEGVVRMFSNTGTAAGLARIETGLTLVYLGSAMFYAKLSAKPAPILR
jgi:uncharacterized membrane protein